MLVFSIFLYTVFAMSITAVVPWTPTVIMFSVWFPGSNNVSTFLRQWEAIAGTENKLYTTYQRSQ
jgi:predicted metalloprotease with PDZ domain